MEQCENLFQKSNLSLLAQQYNVDASKAAVIQAKIWDRPYVSSELNLLNPPANKMFDVGSYGQKTLAIQQLIYLGGKKRKEVDFAKSNVGISELQFEQLLRNLRFELQQSFYQVYFNQKKANSLKSQLANLDSLINTYSVQAEKGNVPLKDVVRLQSLSLFFKNELLDIQKDIFVQQENLKILTNTSENINALVSEDSLNQKYLKPILQVEEQLQKKALQKNPEYLTALKIMESNDLMLKWQKSLATPDITVGANYDQRGGAFNNQVNLTFGIPLPLWNTNRGNIKMAAAQLGQTKMLKEQKVLEINSKVSTAYNTFIYQQNQYQQSVSIFQNFEKVYRGILQNFQKRNITMIEFTDFMESYNQSILFLNEIKKQVIINGENLNYLTNEKVF
ncbi:MAG: TolC family protein [bacterium]|nr:TolC family protein [bacterium]